MLTKADTGGGRSATCGPLECIADNGETRGQDYGKLRPGDVEDCDVEAAY